MDWETHLTGEGDCWPERDDKGNVAEGDAMKLPELPGGDTRADRMIGVGFGQAELTRDGEAVWRENRSIGGWKDYLTFGQAADLAAAEPDHDWRIVLRAARWNEAYQWQGRWVLVERGEGFA